MKRLCLSIYLYTCVCVVFINIYVCMYMHLHLWIHVCECLYIHVHVYMCIHIISLSVLKSILKNITFSESLNYFQWLIFIITSNVCNISKILGLLYFLWMFCFFSPLRFNNMYIPSRILLYVFSVQFFSLCQYWFSKKCRSNVASCHSSS